MNRVELVGRLTAKPELRYTQNNLPNTKFTLAVNRQFSNAQGEKEADFINIVAWRKQAENVAQFLDKGSLVAVEGRIQTGSYDNKEGKKVYTFDVVADSVQFLDNKKEGQAVSPKDFENKTNSEVLASAMSEDPFQNAFAEFGDTVSLADDELD